MIYLLFSIISSSLIYTVFKLLGKFNINTLYAIVINYYTAFFAGYLLLERDFKVTDWLQQSFFLSALLLGVLFISVFKLMAETTRISGLSAVSVASKMSLAIPVVFVIIYYQESLNFLKVIGIITALIAVYFSALKSNKLKNIRLKTLLFPLGVFFGSGIIETLIKFVEEHQVANSDVALFSMSIFFFAAVIGSIAGTIQYKRKAIPFKKKDFLGGIALGIPNYFSVYFFVLSLRSFKDASMVFIVNNVSIVLLSTLIGIIFFKEKLIRKNWWGILLAIISLILITLTNQ